MTISEKIKTCRVYFDGGTGTMLQSMGLMEGEIPEQWNLSHPDRITELHRAYYEAGCDIIKTNTFGANKLKCENFKEVIAAGIECAHKAKEGFTGKYIAFDVGPTGKLLEPLGELPFEDAVSVFAENVKVAVECGVDLILIETMNDSYETKAAVLAAKENCDLPVFVTNVYDENGNLMTGADPAAMIAMLEGMGVDALGINCSLGPDKMIPIVEKYEQYSSLPIIVNPNAGLPSIEDGKTVFNIDADEFSDIMCEIARKGACILGGCCGTTPEYIRKTIEKTRDIEFKLPYKKHYTLVSSYTHSVEIGKSPVLIGERINPTGKPKLKEALRNKDMNFILGEAISQVEKGVHILDVNVGLPEIDEPEMMEQVVCAVQSVTDTVLQIDTSDTNALERALRKYNGKALVNSVNGKQESMEAVFPLVKKYGGAVIALTLDENGIPDTAQKRLEIAERIVNCAEQYGIDRKNIIADPLALTISSGPDAAQVTLESIRLIKERLGIATSLGVSNISFGLPSRDIINSAFFTMALASGLDCAIMNPFSQAMMNSYYGFSALSQMDPYFERYIAYASDNQPDTNNKPAEEISLKHAIIKGLNDAAVNEAKKLMETEKPIDVINQYIVPALNEVGELFDKKKVFLPQLLMSAEAASRAFEVVKKDIPASEREDNKKFVIATVKGDVHDIGKNIVKVLLESYGFNVIDLGKDVPPETVCEAAIKNECQLIGLSALMTTTVPSMEETIKQLHEKCGNVTVVVGGAVLTQEYADMIGADCYAADAMETVRFAEKFYS